MDISKAIDKSAGMEREVVGTKHVTRRLNAEDVKVHNYSVGAEGHGADIPVTAPATDAAKQWDGWGTALKPSHEPIIVARKPFDTTVATNVTTYGTGALNIDACRVATAPEDATRTKGQSVTSAKNPDGLYGDFSGMDTHQTEGQKLGRWPPNTVFSHGPDCVRVGARTVKATSIHGTATAVRRSGVHAEAGGHQTVGCVQPVRGYADEHGNETIDVWDCEPGCPVAELDRQSGAVGAAAPASSPRGVGRHDHGIYRPAADGFRTDGKGSKFYADRGGASRMFPCFDWSAERQEAPAVLAGLSDPLVEVAAPFHYFTKPAAKERQAGCDHLDPRPQDPTRDADAPGANNPRNRGGKARGNNHPTVKPISLMRWLVRLVTPPGGVVLDPFTGSGTTGCAAVLEGFDFVGIEREQDYIDIAAARLTYWSAAEGSR